MKRRGRHPAKRGREGGKLAKRGREGKECTRISNLGQQNGPNLIRGQGRRSASSRGSPGRGTGLSQLGVTEHGRLGADQAARRLVAKKCERVACVGRRKKKQRASVSAANDGIQRMQWAFTGGISPGREFMAERKEERLWAGQAARRLVVTVESRHARRKKKSRRETWHA